MKSLRSSWLLLFSLLLVFCCLTSIQAGTCGSRSYNPSHQACCCLKGNCRVHSSLSGNSCCGLYIMNPKVGEYCCGTSFDRVCRTVTTGNGLCGGKRINTFADICCEGERVSKVHGIFCCGKKSYNASYNVCCNGVIRSVVSGTFCCGTRNFPPRYQCCDVETEKVRVMGRC